MALQNTSSVSTNATNKAALVTDLNPTYVGTEQYSHARNAVRNSKEGDIGTIGNEPSNTSCFSAPYKIVGTIELPTDEILVFSTDNVSSEIGIANTDVCSYRTLLNMACLNFKDSNIVTGKAKRDFQKGIVVYFTDKLNPIRRIELDKIDEIETCDDILLFKKIDYPCIEVTKGQVGNMPNGVYSVAIAYVVDNQVFSDWYAITNRIALHSENQSNSLEITLSNIDTEFEDYAVAVIANYVDPVTKGATKLAKIVGTFSTKIVTISVTDFINSNYLDIPISQLVVQKKTWVRAGIIASNANYLFFADLVSRPEENYQLKAMGITAKYVVEQVPAEYYEQDGRDVGYYRDENYDFHIQGIYNTGELTEKFHIPGKRATREDLAAASGKDVYEFDKQFGDCITDEKVPRWKVENTAGKMIPTNAEFICGRRVLGTGDFGYFESTIPYPDNVDTFGDDANTPIRYHKFPDECKVPRYSVVNGKTYINILGVQFNNIPSFDNPDIVGYKITRSDRKGGNGTVVARGLMTNIRSYVDSTFNQEVYYSNYPVNDLSADQYISSTQTVYKNNRENNFTPLTTYHKDKFSFYSPHTLFEPRYKLGTEIKIETEEIATVRGQFEDVFNHPESKLMNQFTFWLSAAIGFIESTLVLGGKTDLFHLSGTKIGIDGGPYFEIGENLKISTFDDLLRLQPGQLVQATLAAIKAADPAKIGTIINLITTILQTIAGLALKGAYAILAGLQVAQNIFDTIFNLTGTTKYVYQYNAEAIFDRSVCVKTGNKRRRLLREALYIPSTSVSIDDKIFNNLFRERTVYLELNKEIDDPSVTDNTRQTAAGFGVCDDITQKTSSTASAFYVTSKIPNPNQYGQLGSAAPVSMHSCGIAFGDSPILYGGDCIITRFQFQKKMKFFTQDLANTNFRDTVEYDYRRYRNIGYPRFWIDTTKFDFSEVLSSNIVNFSRFSRTTTNKHNLDCKGDDGGSIARIDDAYMYLSNNAGIDFFVEADYYVDFREDQSNELPYYSKKNRDVSQIFRSDRLPFPEEFNINRAFSDIYTTEVFAPAQRDDFDPLNPIPTDQPNSVIYSLPSFNLQEVDNWQYFLPANYFAFRESDFGRLTGMHKLDQDRVIFLFSRSSPFITMGRDFLELEGTGRKVTIGDGGLFAQDPREIMPTDNDYGACNSRFAFSNTHLGRYYPSERQGRILNFTESLDDITRQGISYWCKNYMPIFLYKHFPAYPREENPVSGVGYLTVFDSFNETIYITKRDFVPKRELISDITYNNGFFYKNDPISIRDTRYFNDVSWTLSYCPLDKAFVSWHDWHPDWVIQRDTHFMTVKDKTAYKHNENYESFCNFYGVDYPFEIEFVSSSGQQIHIARCLEYFLEAYHYKNFGRDRFHVHHENFSHLIVSNTEQISPLCNLVYRSNNPEKDILYPIRNTTNPVMFDILFSKEENKYRINQFWDAVKDRGEFSNTESHLFPTDESGYKQVINPIAIDTNKPEEQRKKFRHYFNKFRLIRSISGANKFIVKLFNIKKLLSIR